MQGHLELHTEFETSLRYPVSKYKIVFKERESVRLGMGDGARKVTQA